VVEFPRIHDSHGILANSTTFNVQHFFSLYRF
jgi:hypothetical protein